MIGNLEIGQRLPCFLLPTSGGTLVNLKDLLGKKFLLFGWSSWDASKEYLPSLETFYKKHKKSSFDIVSVAFDVQGPELPMRYLTKYKVSFTLLIDAYALLSRILGVKDLPFAIFVDEDFIIRSLTKTPSSDFLSEIENKLSESLRKEQVIESDKFSNSVPRSEILLQNCTNLLGRGKVKEAIGKLKEAYSIDNSNEIIRKQIAVLETPDKFYK